MRRALIAGGPGSDLAGVWSEARPLLRRLRVPLGVGLLLMLVNRGAAFVLPAGSRILVDDVIGQGRRELLVPLALAALAAAALEGATSFALTRVVGIAALRAITELRNDLQGRLIRLPVSFFDGQQSGALLTRTTADVEQVRWMLASGLVPLASGIVTAALALAILVALDWRLTLVVVIPLVGVVVATAKGFARLHPAFLRVSQLNAELGAWLSEVLSGVRVVKSYAAEWRAERDLRRASRELLGAGERAVGGVAAVNALTTLATGVVSVVVLAVGGRAVARGEMTLGDLAMFGFLVGLLASPLVQIAAVGGEAGKAIAGLARISSLRRERTEDEEDRERSPVASVAGAVELERVGFEYVPGVPVLREVNLFVPAGSTVALVGPSGAGKSTLCRLLLAYERPTRGRVLVDGRDLALLRRGEYRAHLGVVLQDDVLFHGSIADNIRFARPGAGMGEVRAASQLAHCEEFIERLPEGYDTVVGERGVRLSGGQRQRVAIARAILADPRILILDEATCQLDGDSEALVRDALRVLCRGRTTIVIAHRMATVRSADQIVVLERGRIVERGTHEELVRSGGRYREMVAGEWDGWVGDEEIRNRPRGRRQRGGVLDVI